MQRFEDESGREWVATAREEQTPRHHTRWYLVFHRAGEGDRGYGMSEVRWQTEGTAERTNSISTALRGAAPGVSTPPIQRKEADTTGA